MVFHSNKNMRGYVLAEHIWGTVKVNDSDLWKKAIASAPNGL